MDSNLEKLNDATCRIERVIYLAGAMAAGDAFSGDLDDFLDDEDEETITGCLGDVPGYVDLDGRGRERSENIFEWLRNVEKMGFLVKFATPVMEPISDDCRSFSWGYYRSQWFYADTVDQAVDLGLAWVEACRAKEDEKAKQKGDES